MKKTLIFAGFALLLIVMGFMWLVSAASPENAPPEVKVIDLTNKNTN